MKMIILATSIVSIFASQSFATALTDVSSRDCKLILQTFEQLDTQNFFSTSATMTDVLNLDEEMYESSLKMSSTPSYMNEKYFVVTSKDKIATTRDAITDSQSDTQFKGASQSLFMFATEETKAEIAYNLTLTSKDQKMLAFGRMVCKK